MLNGLKLNPADGEEERYGIVGLDGEDAPEVDVDVEESGGTDPGLGRNVFANVVGIVGNNPAMSVLWPKGGQQVYHVMWKVDRLTYHNTKRENEPLPPPVLVPIRSLILRCPEALAPPRSRPPFPISRPSL
jgi:hypothetical protein